MATAQVGENMVWMINGKKQADYLGAKGCKTSLKSSAQVIGLNGKSITPTAIDESDIAIVPTWKNLEQFKEIRWEAQTLSDKKPVSDRIEVELQLFDMVYVTSVTNAAMDAMTEEQMALALDDPGAFTEALMPLVEERMQPELTLKTVHSTIVNTGPDGKTSGVIPLLAQYPPGTYTLMIHYGYSQAGEASDSKKEFEFWVMEMLPIILEISLVIIAGIASGGLAVAAYAGAVAAMSFDIANIANQYQTTRFGVMGENKHDCVFPYGGFIHSYSISYGLEDEATTVEGGVSPHNMEIAGAVENYIATKSLLHSIGFGTMAVALLLILVAKMKGRKKDE